MDVIDASRCCLPQLAFGGPRDRVRTEGNRSSGLDRVTEEMGGGPGFLPGMCGGMTNRTVAYASVNEFALLPYSA